MQVLLSSSHCFPARRAEGAGLNTTLYPSGSAYMTHDLLAKGLAELGHKVFYFPRRGALAPLPEGVTLVGEPTHNVDIHHMLIDTDEYLYWEDRTWPTPRVISCHIDPRLIDRNWGEISERWIFVSRSLAQSLGRNRFVWNGIDPDEYIFSANKQDYHLFMAPMDWAMKKGFDVAVELARSVGFRLIVAGGSRNREVISEIASICGAFSNIEYVGDVRGAFKAELLAGARSLIFPTKVNEAFGLVIAEALMSGTPVICSKNGACSELVSPDVGFLCDTKNDYISALNNVEQIRPERCREKALRDFHYGRMAQAYVAEYERELAST
jgi:glycosyltransferase involved in cell wall biosynthesis